MRYFADVLALKLGDIWISRTYLLVEMQGFFFVPTPFSDLATLDMHHLSSWKLIIYPRDIHWSKSEFIVYLTPIRDPKRGN